MAATGGFIFDLQENLDGGISLDRVWNDAISDVREYRKQGG